MVDSVLNYIVAAIHNNAKNPHSTVVLRYALGNLLNLIFTIAMVLVVCAIMGNIVSGLVAVLAFSVLRMISGGLHFRSADVCNIVSALLVLTAVFVPEVSETTALLLTSFAAALTLLFAPSGIKDKRVKRNKTMTKLLGMIVIMPNLLLGSELLAMVFFIQSLTTLPILHRIVDEYNL